MYMGLPEVVRWVGFIISIIICIFLLWVFKTIGKAGSKHLIVSEEMKLVTTGPYSRIRHPMYTLFTLYSLTLLLVTDHWAFSGTFFGLMLFIMLVRTPEEEKVLIEKFGDEYRHYMERTSRYLPLKSKKKPDSSD
jgi:protein-S-isoprenylcysteine O-methyltransferase Ste14